MGRRAKEGKTPADESRREHQGEHGYQEQELVGLLGKNSHSGSGEKQEEGQLAHLPHRSSHGKAGLQSKPGSPCRCGTCQELSYR